MCNSIVADKEILAEFRRLCQNFAERDHFNTPFRRWRIHSLAGRIFIAAGGAGG
jgi:hypothetical protein